MEFTALHTYFSKEDRFHINSLKDFPKEKGKKSKLNSQEKMKEIIRLEQKPMKYKTERTMENQWNRKFALWKDYKIDKLWARLIKKKKNKLPTSRMKNVCQYQPYIEVKRIVRGYYELCQQIRQHR